MLLGDVAQLAARDADTNTAINFRIFAPSFPILGNAPHLQRPDIVTRLVDGPATLTRIHEGPTVPAIISNERLSCSFGLEIAPLGIESRLAFPQFRHRPLSNSGRCLARMVGALALAWGVECEQFQLCCRSHRKQCATSDLMQDNSRKWCAARVYRLVDAWKPPRRHSRRRAW